MKINATPEGRENIWIPEKKSLKDFIKSKKFTSIHNFVGTQGAFLGADHEVESVLEDIDKAERVAIFTDSSMNIGHSLALVTNNKLEVYDMGEITKADIELKEQNNGE